jgi:ubiquinone/menaquinone biosynthesis C-methylase UbiE
MFLPINIKALKGETVLEIGPGLGKFQKEAAKLGINVIAIEPLDPTRAEPGWKVEGMNWVTGIHEALPIAGNSVGAALSLYSSVFYAFNTYYPNQDDIKKAVRLMIKETYRVLKPGGEAYIGAFNEKEEEVVHSLLGDVVRKSEGMRFLSAKNTFNKTCFILRKS